MHVVRLCELSGLKLLLCWSSAAPALVSSCASTLCDRCHAAPTRHLLACRLDECHRVLQAGARVLTLDQLEGLKVRWLAGWGSGVFKAATAGLAQGLLCAAWVACTP